MANGEVTITFDGVNLAPCIKQGLEIYGTTKCLNCKQSYRFRLHIDVKNKQNKYVDKEVNGEVVTMLVPDTYDVSIKFVRPHGPVDETGSVDGPSENPGEKEKCVPCNGCTPNCDRL
jgi:hypothetical protein